MVSEVASHTGWDPGQWAQWNIQAYSWIAPLCLNAWGGWQHVERPTTHPKDRRMTEGQKEACLLAYLAARETLPNGGGYVPRASQLVSSRAGLSVPLTASSRPVLPLWLPLSFLRKYSWSLCTQLHCVQWFLTSFSNIPSCLI